MRRLLVLLLFFVPTIPVFAQTATPTPAPTVTPTMTPDVALYVTVIPPGGTLSDAQAGAIVLQVDVGEVGIAIPLFGLLVVKLFTLIQRARGRDA